MTATADLTLVAASAAGGIVFARNGMDGWTVGKVLGGQDVRCIAVDPSNGQSMFAGTQGNGIFHSTDAWDSWSQAGLEGEVVKSVAVAPSGVYAGTKPPKVFVSADSGRTWRERESFRHIPGRRLWWSPAEPPGTAYVQSLATSPTDPEVILAGIELGAVVRSEDGGKTWSRHLKGTLRDCHALKFHDHDGAWAYEAGGSGGGASVSRDGGATWDKVKEGLDRNYAVACAADPDRPDTWYISVSPSPWKAHGTGGAEAYIFRTQDSRPWVRLAGGLPQPLDSMPYGLATVAGRPGLVLASLRNGQVWASENYGNEWNRLEVDLGPTRLGLLALG